MRIVVVLPAPFAPRKPKTTPRGTDPEADSVEGLHLAEPFSEAIDRQRHPRSPFLPGDASNGRPAIIV